MCDGDQRPVLEAALEREGVSHLVRFAGWVPREEVPALLQAADACVDPAPPTTVNQLSTMMKIAEYLALGKPLVAYDLVEARRTAGDAALLVAPGDVAAFTAAIARLAHDPQLRSALAHAGRERARALTWDHSERALLGAYAALSAGSGAEQR